MHNSTPPSVMLRSAQQPKHLYSRQQAAALCVTTMATKVFWATTMYMGSKPHSGYACKTVPLQQARKSTHTGR